MKKKLKSLSIVMPVYNERRTIKKIIDKVLKADTLHLKKELIIIDDGSTDGTREILAKLNNQEIRTLLLNNNSGKGLALRKGFALARGDILLVQDADLEYDPADYHNLLIPILKGDARVVYGSRMMKHGKMKHGGIIFYAGGQLINKLTNYLYNLNLTDEATGYKIFESKILDEIDLTCRRFEFCPEFTAKVSIKKIPIMEIPISYSGRTVSEGKKIRWRDGAEAVWTLLKYRIKKFI